MEIDAQLRCRNCGWNGTRSELTPLGSVGRLHCPVCNAEYGTRDGVPAAGADVGLLPEDSRFFMKPSLDLSLFHLDRDLAGLIEYRQERIADAADPPSEDELKALELEIRRYLEALPKKVSGTVAVVRHWRSQRMAAKQEIDRLKAIVAHLDAMEARLLDYCGEILEKQPEPKKGCRKLTGTDGSTISLKGNGGVQALDIYDPEGVPHDCWKTTIAMPTDEWEGMKEHFLDIGLTLISERSEPDPKAIREAIEDVGGVPGARLLERGKHVEIK